MTEDTATRHASAVAVDGRALLLLGPSGSGKSALALDLMALGAGLIADDRVALTRREGAVIASAPPGLPPMIEARGIGLLNTALAPPAPLALALDLSEEESERLPPLRHITILGCGVPLLLRPTRGSLASGLIQLMRAGRATP